MLGEAVYFDIDLQTESEKFAELIPSGDDRNFLSDVLYMVSGGIFEDNEASKSGGALFMTLHEIADASLVNIITY